MARLHAAAAAAADSQQPWLPGFIERMTCCAMPNDSMTSMVVGGDDDSIVLPSHQRRQPISQLVARPAIQDLPSPTLSPSRRELEPWDPNNNCCPSNAGSVATTASIQSYEDFEIRSNATTEVVSHRHRVLLQSTLATAEQRFVQEKKQERRQARQEEKAHRYLMPQPKR